MATGSVEKNQFDVLMKWFTDHVQQPYMPHNIFHQRLALVSNEAFTYLTWYGTEKVQGNALDYDSKTVQPGKLFSTEYLPQETIMYLTANAKDEMTSSTAGKKAGELFKFVFKSLADQRNVMQFGGQQSTDSGIASLKWNFEELSYPIAEGADEGDGPSPTPVAEEKEQGATA
jgi:CRISPR/Cas system CMR subunit Cmr4 (Cas7 group RAMP superfamily)